MKGQRRLCIVTGKIFGASKYHVLDFALPQICEDASETANVRRFFLDFQSSLPTPCSGCDIPADSPDLLVPLSSFSHDSIKRLQEDEGNPLTEEEMTGGLQQGNLSRPAYTRPQRPYSLHNTFFEAACPPFHDLSKTINKFL